MSAPLKIALIAGETSGDQLGAWLMEALKAKRPDVQFIGLGGPMMEAQGLASIFPICDIALIGIAEVLPHVRTLTKRIRQTVEFIEQEKPDIVVTIDVPGFALRVLKQLHARGKVRPKLVHYVAPTVWAYRPERAKIVAERYDHLLCLLPFEPPYFEDENLPTTYIGHEIAWWWKTRGDGAAFRARHQPKGPQKIVVRKVDSTWPMRKVTAEELETAPLLAVFPGSRKGEIDRLWPIFRKAIETLRHDIPLLQVAIQVPESLLAYMAKKIGHWHVAPHLLASTTEKKDLFAAATAALAKSGTIGLECALAGLPSIVAYRANPISVFLLRRMIKVPYVNLANILAGKMVVPELLQEDCTPEKLAAALTPLLTDAHARAAQRAELTRIAEQLGVNDSISPSEKAAEIILGMV
jgi:lipid-A-disaccharide synthase